MAAEEILPLLMALWRVSMFTFSQTICIQLITTAQYKFT